MVITKNKKLRTNEPFEETRWSRKPDESEQETGSESEVELPRKATTPPSQLPSASPQPSRNTKSSGPIFPSSSSSEEYEEEEKTILPSCPEESEEDESEEDESETRSGPGNESQSEGPSGGGDEEDSSSEEETEEPVTSTSHAMPSYSAAALKKAGPKKTEKVDSKKIGKVEHKMSGKTERMSQSTRAGLIFPVSRVQKMLSKGNFADRTLKGAGVYLAAVLEYMVAELIEIAALACHDNGKKKITPRHIKLAIGNDEEISKLLDGVVISDGGVIPHIEPAMKIHPLKAASMKANERKKARSSASSQGSNDPGQ
jgi:histone H2A